MLNKTLPSFAALCLLAGCIIDFNADVPCDSDRDCPSGNVCNLQFFRCVEGESDGDTSEDADVTDDTAVDAPTDTPVDVPDDGSGDTTTDVPVDVPTDGSGDTAVDVPTDVPDGSDTGECIPSGPEVCDGADNDCNGTIDDGGVCTGPCPGGMVLIDLGDGGRFCIDTYEASRSDASAASGGTDASRATSRSGVLPWAAVAFADANAACTAAGKRLCTAFEWQTACQGPALSLYPYGNAYESTTCNGSNTPPIDGPAPTGAFDACVSDYGTLDQSGNLVEWTTDGILRGGAFADPQLNLRCSYRLTDSGGDPLPSYGFRCCKDEG